MSNVSHQFAAFTLRLFCAHFMPILRAFCAYFACVLRLFYAYFLRIAKRFLTTITHYYTYD
ncbi:hypothetical protein HMPREF9296_0029 [Prevotella disiens FB035-09AN]|uniref:Uncharacterized protein n=1 Tax=Prevotella disiens FB035-09AN TaxID=866771 RepID=E1KUF6_9BACT|nr:hypothetical protein HMPREF9296_0029 [Prevotella disiens FB035-09AN]